MLRATGVTASVALAAIVVLAGIGLVTAGPPTTYCLDRPADFPRSGVDGWRGEQLENAAVIMRTAREAGLGRDGQVLGVMAAMGESSLHNLDHGDWETSGVVNPDGTRTSSIGLFQQQDWWGSTAARMDPATAAGLFFARLQRLPDWRTMAPSHAIHRVQVNADREHYARFAGDAEHVVDALSGPCAAARR